MKDQDMMFQPGMADDGMDEIARTLWAENGGESMEGENVPRKFELTDTVKEVDGRQLYQIKATESFRTADGRMVNSGDLGGWVEKRENLSDFGNAWVDKDAAVYGNAKVMDNALVGGAAIVKDDAVVKNDAIVGQTPKLFGLFEGKADSPVVSGHAVIEDQARVLGDAQVADNARIGNYARVENHAIVRGDTLVNGDARVRGDAVVEGSAYVTEKADIFDHAQIQDKAVIGGQAVVGGEWVVGGATELKDRIAPVGTAGHVFGTEHLDDIQLFGKGELGKDTDERKVYHSGIQLTSERVGERVNEARGKLAEALFGDVLRKDEQSQQAGPGDPEK